MQTTLTIVQLIDLFLSEHDVKDGSKRLYRSNLNLFFRWCSLSGFNPRDVTRQQVLKYKQHLVSSGLSVLTSNCRLTTLRLFYDWLEVNKYFGNNPTVGVKNLKSSKKYRKDPLTDEQVSKLLSVIDTSSDVGKRNMAIVLLMLANGLREVEVSRLDYGDIREQGDMFVMSVQRKGRDSKDSTLRLSSNALDAISEYLATRDVQRASSPLFVIYSNNSKGIRMQPKAISNMVTSLLVKSGVKSSKVTPHSLRHTAATMLLEAGQSIYDVQSMLGHSTPATTEIYVSQIEAKRRLYNSPVVQLDAILSRNKATALKMVENG